MRTATGNPARPLIVPATIVADVCYMITRYRFGSAAEAAFLRSPYMATEMEHKRWTE